MIENFLSHKKEGKTNKEIADMYGLSMWTLHHYLQEIAENNGVTRDDLLDRVHKPYEVTVVSNRKPLEQVDVEEQLIAHFSKMIDEVDKIIFNLNTILEENEEAVMEEK